jgi:hypothetical protein
MSTRTILKIVIATGESTTLASGFSIPLGITTDGTNLYVADGYTHTICKVVIATGVVTTLTGTAGTSESTNGSGTCGSASNIDPASASDLTHPTT